MLLFPPGMAGLWVPGEVSLTAEHVPQLDRRSGQSYSGRWLVPSRPVLLLLLLFVLPIFLILNAFSEIHIMASWASRRWLQLYGR